MVLLLWSMILLLWSAVAVVAVAVVDVVAILVYGSAVANARGLWSMSALLLVYGSAVADVAVAVVVADPVAVAVIAVIELRWAHLE